MTFHIVSSQELGKNRTKNLSIRKHLSWVGFEAVLPLRQTKTLKLGGESATSAPFKGIGLQPLQTVLLQRDGQQNTRHRYPLINAPLLQLILVGSKYIRDIYKTLQRLKSIYRVNYSIAPSNTERDRHVRTRVNSKAEKSSYGQKWKQTAFPAETTE